MSQAENENKQEQPPVRTYAILQETSGEESESWYTFIKVQGNEEALAHLEKQLDSVEQYILDDLSTFDLETKNPVSEQTAKEMTKVDLNHFSFHRKFDGTMKKVNLGFKDHYSVEKKMAKAFAVLGYGKIESFLSDEDIDPADLNDESDTESSIAESEESETSSEDEAQPEEPEKPAKIGKLPKFPKKPVDMPGFARAKAKRRH